MQSHPRAGDTTGFVEKILSGEKKHTIRSSKYRWKAGDKFSPRIWTGKPYRSPQQELSCGVLTVVNTWDILIKPHDYSHFPLIYLSRANVEVNDKGSLYVHLCSFFGSNCRNIGRQCERQLAMNDGLSLDDFFAWFTLPFKGQIICWDKDLNYDTLKNRE
jgi:hypothetical protein